MQLFVIFSSGFVTIEAQKISYDTSNYDRTSLDLAEPEIIEKRREIMN